MTTGIEQSGLPPVVDRVAQSVIGTERAGFAAGASPASASKPTFALAPGQRELRLDLFRGLALWLIYIDHVSPDLLTWFTIRNYGFSDAAEIFIFISGFTAALVYGRAMFETGFMIGTARVARRVWQIYTAHLLLFLVLMAEIAYVATVSSKPEFYIQEMEVAEFFKQPGMEVIQTLLLRFRPLNMDVLPLYVVLMAFLPLVLLLAKLHRDLPLAASAVLYVLTVRYDLHLSTYPDGFWSFNPYAWQLLFVFGAWCALGGARRLAPILASRTILWLAVAYLCATFFVTMTWYFPHLESLIPGWLARWIYPINKTDFDILRFVHFLSLAVVALRFVPPGWSGLQSPWLWPLILCGQYSLQIFALGVALSFAGYALLMELNAGVILHVVVGLAGLLIMYGVVTIFSWYKRATSGRARVPARSPDCSRQPSGLTDMASFKMSPYSFAVERDLRLDLLRGLGLWMIFLDHIPDDVVAWLTLRNYGFSDAAEFFVFISGYLLGFIYAPIVFSGQFFPALKRLWLRAWQMYVAHILLFLAFTAQIARTARKWDNPMYKDEFNVANFLANPDEMIGKALTLQYKPVDLDVLPLYIALVAVSPFVVWCLVRRPNLTLAGSVILYVLARYFDWNLPSYPKGATWYFNPFAWQLMFFFGAWCGCGAVSQIRKLLDSRIAFGIAIAWILFALLIVMTWHSAFLESMIPKWMIKAIYPIDKTNLDMLRFTHFCALALVLSRYLSRDWSGLKSIWLRPLVLCGQHSLPLFCLGVFLSFGVHWMLVQWKSAVLNQLLLSIGGMAVMTVVAWLLDRAQRVPNLFVSIERDAAPAPDTAPQPRTA